jgi:outer membrane protein assembly factor BamB
VDRRSVLALVGAGITSTSGCLRLQGGGNSTAQEPSTPEETSPEESSSTDTPSDGTNTEDGSNEVTLTESWTDENGVDNIWTREGTFYYNDYNYAAEASHGDGVSWSADTTYDGFERNFGAQAFAADRRYAVFGYTPEVEENEEQGAHFHAYRRYDGEKAWTVGAPSDGSHKWAVGATVVGDTAVLGVADYGEGSAKKPLVYGVDIETGETRWQVDKSVLSGESITYVGSYDGNVYLGVRRLGEYTDGVQVLAGETGELVETHEGWAVGSAGLGSVGQIHGETLFACFSSYIAAYPLGENGLSRSPSEFDSRFNSLVVDNSLVVAGTEDGGVYAFERGSGETRWEASITNSVGAVETTGSHVWVGDTDIGLTAYDRETGSLVHRSTKPVNGDDIAVADDELLLGGDTATAYTID